MQDSEVVGSVADIVADTQMDVVAEELAFEITEMEETVSEKSAVVSEIIDYTKLSFEERAALLPVPMDDYEAEYDAYRQRMGYTEEKMKGIRYKITAYDEFLKEYNYRKKHYGVRNDSRTVAVSEKSREVR